MIKGKVSGFRERSEVGQFDQRVRPILVWDFRLERFEPSGKPLPRVAVEMRGYSFSGLIANGDVVEIDQPDVPGQLIRTDAVRNLTSNSTVTVLMQGRFTQSATARRLAMVVIVVIVAIILAIWAVLAWQATR
jgi:hypothetical protein